MRMKRSLILALIDANHFDKTRKTDTLGIIQKQCSELLRIDDDEEWNCFYESQAASLETKPCPSLERFKTSSR